MHDLINEAHQEGMPVIMHAPSFNGQKFALEAGVDIIAHSMWNWYDSPEQFLDLTFTQEHKDLILKIANSKVGYQPTFRAIYGEVDLLNGQFINDPALKNVYPKAYFDWMKRLMLNFLALVNNCDGLTTILLQISEANQTVFLHLSLNAGKIQKVDALFEQHC